MHRYDWWDYFNRRSGWDFLISRLPDRDEYTVANNNNPLSNPGYTKSTGKGTPKARRKMAKQSRKINRHK